jgi:hypothetical protein
MGMVLLVAYVWLRWRVASSETDRLAAEMQLGPGVWVLAHAVLLAGAVLLIRAAWPKSKVW